jgi:hypothetical protein
MRPIVHGLEADYGNCIDFVYLDIDDSATAAAKSKYKFLAQPLLIVEDGSGKELWRKFGRIDRAALEAELKNALQPTP